MWGSWEALRPLLSSLEHLPPLLLSLVTDIPDVCTLLIAEKCMPVSLPASATLSFLAFLMLLMLYSFTALCLHTALSVSFVQMWGAKK